MESVINDRLSEVRDLKDILRSIARMREVKSGTYRVAAGRTRGQVNFQDGFIVGATASSLNELHGKSAFEALMSLPEIVCEFVAEQAPLSDRRDELCIEISQLIQNHFSLEGIPWAPRAGVVRTKTGSLPAFSGQHLAAQDEDVETVTIPATQAAENFAMANENELDEQEATGPMPAQGDPKPEAATPAYDLSALEAIPTPAVVKPAAATSGGTPMLARLAPQLQPQQPALQPGPQSAPQPPPQPGPQTGAQPGPQTGTQPDPQAGTQPVPQTGAQLGPQTGAQPGPQAGTQPGHQAAEPGAQPGPVYDLAALESIPTPAIPRAPKVIPPSQPPKTPKPSTPAYDLSALEKIPTPAVGTGASLTPSPQPAMQSPEQLAQPNQVSPARLESAPEPQAQPPRTAASAYDLSALESIPTPGTGRSGNLSPPVQRAMPAQPAMQEQPAMPAQPAIEAEHTTPSKPEMQSQPAETPTARPYDPSVLDSIPTPAAKPLRAQEPVGLMKRMAQSTESSSPASQQISPSPLIAPRIAPQQVAPPVVAAPAPAASAASAAATPAPVPVPPQPVPLASSPEELIAPWSKGEGAPAAFPMQRVASIFIVIVLALAAFALPGMIRQSMKPANVEPDMNKTQMKGFVTDQMKEQTPYVH